MRKLALLALVALAACHHEVKAEPGAQRLGTKSTFIALAVRDGGEPVLVQTDGPIEGAMYVAVETDTPPIPCVECNLNRPVFIPDIVCKPGECNPPVHDRASRPAQVVRATALRGTVRKDSNGELVIELRALPGQ